MVNLGALGDNCYMSMQKWVETRNLSRLRIKVRPFEVFPYYVEAMHLQCKGRARGYIDDPLPNTVRIAIWTSACLTMFHHAVVSDHFFFCLVCGLLEKKSIGSDIRP